MATVGGDAQRAHQATEEERSDVVAACRVYAAGGRTGAALWLPPERQVPSNCYYWQILVADDRFSTVDWVNRQSSLNDVQARIDPGGWFRGVVFKRDPGVHNWLDKADWPWGILKARFYKAGKFPDVTVTKVPVANVLDHLPAGTGCSHRRSAEPSCGTVAPGPRCVASGDRGNAAAV